MCAIGARQADALQQERGDVFLARPPPNEGVGRADTAMAAPPEATTSQMILTMDDFNDFKQIGKGK